MDLKIWKCNISALFFLSGLICLGYLLWSLAKPSSSGYHSFTKAICSKDNYCQDVFFQCQNGYLLSAEPIGKGIHFDSDWVDPRPENYVQNYWC